MILTAGRRRRYAAWRAMPYRVARDHCRSSVKVRTTPERRSRDLLVCFLSFQGPRDEVGRILKMVTGLGVDPVRPVGP